jgi:NTE family protein
MADCIKRDYDNTVLVLQGGGALGAYQAGVYEGLAEAGYAPNWVTGVSIGAINAALIAGNLPELRVERLREFWNLVSSGLLANAPRGLDGMHRVFNRASSAISAAVGVPGFYRPRMPPAALMPHGHPDGLSLYDTRSLRGTLERLVDFDLINGRQVRLSVGAVNVRTGNSAYFDNAQTRLGPEHVMASGALPPTFAPVEIDGERYWDGGIVSNTPLWYVLDDSPRLKGLIVQVDLFNAKGELPLNLDQVMERQKDITYSSKSRFNTSRLTESQRLRYALHRVLELLPEELKTHPDVKALEAMGHRSHVDILHLINRRYGYTTASKDNEFSRATVNQLWASGLDDARYAFAHFGSLAASEGTEGIRVFDILPREHVAVPAGVAVNAGEPVVGDRPRVERPH